MKSATRTPISRLLILAVLLVPYVIPFAQHLEPEAVARSSSRQRLAENDAVVDRDAPARKVAPDLDESIQLAEYQGSSNNLQRVIIQVSESAPELTERASRYAMADKVARFSGRYGRSYKTLGMVSAELPLSRIRELQADPDIAYISPDRPVASLGNHVYLTTGAEDGSDDISSRPLYGRGIGIAILDSGIDTTHELTKTATDHPGVVYSRDFTGQSTIQDRYGHGTHVASLLAGRIEVASGAYTGIARKANLLNLRVLDQNGTGSASNAIAAIDWCITNKAAYNIRVINMSLGSKAVDSYRIDPLCLATRRAHDAGIVVVCAAGNDGKDAFGTKVYGGIHSPGIDPSVITVGATNTFGTDVRSDDVMATYSSHGPTRGYTTDSGGVKHYDNLIKPDLVAPGNKLLGGCSPASFPLTTSLIKMNPWLSPGSVSTTTKQMMYMSGTSMSAALVSGAAAMLLEANPTLTPNLVKAILTYTAQPIRGANNFEQGAGMLNIEGAVKVINRVKSNVSNLSNGASMLSSSITQQYNTGLVGQTIYWGQGVITDYCFVYGPNLMTYWQGAYAQGSLLSDATTVTNGLIRRNTSMTSTGVLLTDGVLLCDGVLLTDGTLFTDGVMLSDGTLLSAGALLTDGALLADGTLIANVAPLGDGAARMQYIPIP